MVLSADYAKKEIYWNQGFRSLGLFLARWRAGRHGQPRAWEKVFGNDIATSNDSEPRRCRGNAAGIVEVKICVVVVAPGPRRK